MATAEFDDGALTGTPDHVYDLVLVLQQALEDCVRYAAFARDADAAGDHELADWFRELSADDRQLSERAKAFLRDRLG